MSNNNETKESYDNSVFEMFDLNFDLLNEETYIGEPKNKVHGKKKNKKFKGSTKKSYKKGMNKSHEDFE